MKRLAFSIALLLFMLSAACRAQQRTNLALGFEHLENGDPKAALSLLHDYYLKGDPELKDVAFYGVAKSYYDDKQHLSATHEFTEFTRLFKGSVLLEDAMYHLMESYAAAKEDTKALGAADDYITEFPDGKWGGRVSFVKGEILLRGGDHNGAYRAFNNADLYYPLSYSGKRAKAEMDKIAKKYRITPAAANPQELYDRGMKYFNQRDYKSAIALFSRLARNFPRHQLNARAFLMLGRAEMADNQGKESIASIERSVSVARGTEQGRALYYLGRARGRRGQYEAAARAMDELVSKYPNSNYADNALYYKGVYYELLDKPDAALNTYIYLITSRPKSFYVDGAILNAGYLLYRRGEYGRSYAMFSQAMNARVGTETPQCLYWWGRLAEKVGSVEAAAGIYNYVATRFDHTYQAYRARERLSELGFVHPPANFPLKSVREGLFVPDQLDEEDLEDAVDSWSRKNEHLLSDAEVSLSISRYNKLTGMGLANFALLEARSLMSRTKGKQRESAQALLARAIQQTGEYSAPIRYVERGIRDAVLKGDVSGIPPEAWKLSYPRGYWNSVEKYSRQFGIDPYLTLAVIREESRFNPRAYSRSRAHGLMQIIPSTGSIIAKQLEIKPFRNTTMYVPETNIKMGTHYLSNLIRRFNGNVFLALAGYNGGPVRVRRWVNEGYNGDNVNLDIDEFIQNIPLRETRYYVQKVMGSYYEYKRIYDGGRS